MDDVLVDLRVDDHPEPVAELARLYGMHQLLFGKTPRGGMAAGGRRARRGAPGAPGRPRLRRADLEKSFNAWAGTENLEDRVAGVDRIDPVVLAELRDRR